MKLKILCFLVLVVLFASFVQINTVQAVFSAPAGISNERNLSNNWNSPQKLTAPVNLGAGWLDQPWISPDGKRLYFVYYDCGLKAPKRQGAQGFFDIYISEKQADGSWGIPVALPPQINSFINEAAAVESFDGTQLFFTSQDIKEAKKNRMRRILFVSRKNPDGSWGLPKSLGHKINAPGMQQDTPSLTADGKILYFMRNSVTPAGVEPDTGMHIYYSTRQDQNCDDCWSWPVLLPAPVTGEREIQPMIRPDGKTLYFTGKLEGKLILQVAYKNDDGSWTAPEPLLDLHDSSAGSMGEGAATLTADGETIYFVRAYMIEGVVPKSPCDLRFEVYSATRKE